AGRRGRQARANPRMTPCRNVDRGRGISGGTARTRTRRRAARPTSRQAPRRRACRSSGGGARAVTPVTENDEPPPERAMSVLRTEAGVRRVQEALREHDIDGWLLYEFHGLNPVAATLLGTGKTTRRGFAFVPRDGEPVALIHAIEHSAWRDWPFAVRTYQGWRDMEASLASLVRECERIAMEVSPGAAVPTLDLVPAGIAGLILESGVELVAS